METVSFSLNHMVDPGLKLAQLFTLASSLGIRTVEIRNDLADNAIADGTSARAVRELARSHNLTIASINALYPFNRWDSALEARARSLVNYAVTADVKGIVLVPLNDGTGLAENERRLRLREALTQLKPLLADNGLTGLVEPLGFDFCSLRSKKEALEAIDAVDGFDAFKLVHDTFHHHIAGEEELFPEHTGLIHISGVEENLAPEALRDPHRVLVSPKDRLNNIGQIKALRSAGCEAPLSFEPFSPDVHRLPDIRSALDVSINFIRSKL